MTDATDGTLLWTGERYIPGTGGAQIAYEHGHRYRASLALASGRDVIDLGSGEGYGASWLSAVAASVVGVDIATDAVEHARRCYRHLPNLRFVEADACLTTLPDECADLIVCFETIEHLEDHEALIAEVDRLLRPDGVVVVSTPDKAQYDADRDQQHNEFHVHELHRHEFEALLKSKFSAMAVFGQRLVSGSLLWQLDETGGASDAQTFVSSCEEDGDNAASDLDPVYLVGVCARSAEVLQAADYGPSSYVDSGEKLIFDLVEQRVHSDTEALWNRVTHQDEEYQAELVKAREQLSTYNYELSDAREMEAAHHEHAVLLAAELRDAESALRRLRDELEHTQGQLRALQAARAASFDLRWQRQRAVEVVGRAARRDLIRATRALLRRVQVAFRLFEDRRRAD